MLLETAANLAVHVRAWIFAMRAFAAMLASDGNQRRAAALLAGVTLTVPW